MSDDRWRELLDNTSLYETMPLRFVKRSKNRARWIAQCKCGWDVIRTTRSAAFNAMWQHCEATGQTVKKDLGHRVVIEKELIIK